MSAVPETSTASAAPAPAHAPGALTPSENPPLAESPRRWLALAALTLSVLIIGLDGTVINVALPTLSGELGATSAQLQWIGGGYLLALSVVMLPAGLLGDRYGHKRLLVGGVALFGLASLAGTQAGTPAELIAVRTVLGAGAALIMPLSMAILPRIFSRQELPKAIATWTAATALGMPVGPVVGGWLLNHFWWGSVFVLNLPVVAVALVAAAWLLPSDGGRPRGAAAPFDTAGTVLSAVGITALVYGTILVPDGGWGSPKVLAGIIGGAVVLVAFVARQRRHPHPLVDLKLFADRAFRWGTLLAVFVNFAVMGILFVVPQYLQSVLGQDAFGTGVRILPLIGGLMVAATLSDPVAARFGAHRVIPGGMLLLAAGAILGATTGTSDGYGFAALWLTLIGVGFGSAMVPATSLVIGSLPAERSGQGTSLLETVQQVGGVLGVAGLGSVLSAGYLDRLAVGHLGRSAAGTARDSVTGADAVASRLHDPALLASAHLSFVHGMDLVLFTCGAFAAVAALVGLFVLPRPGALSGTASEARAEPGTAAETGAGAENEAGAGAAVGDAPAAGEGVAVGGAGHGESVA